MREAATTTNPSKLLLEQAINLSNYVYTSGLSDPPTQFATKLNLQPLMYQGTPYEKLDNSTGFYGEAFIDTSGSKPKLFVAFQGTNPNPPSDEFGAAQAIDDAQIGLGQNANSYQTAYHFTLSAMKIANQQYGVTKANTLLVGHSLGAAEAEYVATQPKTALAGITFGTPGIVPASGSPASRLQNYVEQGDPVGNYASNPPDYLGNHVYSSSIVHYGNTSLVGDSFHSDLLVAANQAYGEHTDAGDALAATLVSAAAYLYHPLGTYAGDLGLQIYSSDNSVGSDVTLCFAAGSSILTTRGPQAVEDLVVGDVAITASGGMQPIIWIGHRDCKCRGLPDLQPVRVGAGAFGSNLPHRDLHLSPGHPVLVGADEDGAGGHLVPVMCLINGTTIRREPVDRVTYWHVELEAHDILLAEGLPCESYIDLGSRPWFDGADGALYDPDMAAPGMSGRCRPVAVDGPVVESARRWLDAVFAARLARGCAWPAEASADHWAAS